MARFGRWLLLMVTVLTLGAAAVPSANAQVVVRLGHRRHYYHHHYYHHPYHHYHHY